MFSQKYDNFKQALEYFVTHLEYIQNNDINIPGYSKYLKPFVDSHTFKTQGAGYSKKRHCKIQEQIDEYSEYEYGKLCITVSPSKVDGKYTGQGCYLHWETTAINIVAIWEKVSAKIHITGLQLLVATWKNNKWDRNNVITKKTLTDLDLFSTNPPNSNLIDFYDSFEELLFPNNKKETEIEKRFEIKSHKAPSERIFRSSKCEKLINIKHKEIQDSIIRQLKKIYGKNAVFQEVIVNDTRLDVLVEIKDGCKTKYDIYEIKPYTSFYSCMREAIGQLIEYKYKALEKNLKIRNLYVVGSAKKDELYLKYIQNNYGKHFHYIQLEK